MASIVTRMSFNKPLTTRIDNDAKTDRVATKKKDREKRKKFHIDEVVEASRKASKLYRNARIRRIHKDGTYDILWLQTGDKENGVEAKRIRKLPDGETAFGKENVDMEKSHKIEDMVTSNHFVRDDNFRFSEMASGEYRNVSQQAIAEGHEAYERRYAGLEAIGSSGMTFLEEMMEAAMGACDLASTARNKKRVGACVLTESGKMYAGCNVESSSDPTLNVNAERTSMLKAVSEGEVSREERDERT